MRRGGWREGWGERRGRERGEMGRGRRGVCGGRGQGWGKGRGSTELSQWQVPIQFQPGN